MQIIAKLAVLGAAIGGLAVAGATPAFADTEPKTVHTNIFPADVPFEDFDDYVRGEIHQHIAGWPGWHHNWRDDDWDDDHWDD